MVSMGVPISCSHWVSISSLHFRWLLGMEALPNFGRIHGWKVVRFCFVFRDSGDWNSIRRLPFLLDLSRSTAIWMLWVSRPQAGVGNLGAESSLSLKKEEQRRREEKDERKRKYNVKWNDEVTAEDMEAYRIKKGPSIQ